MSLLEQLLSRKPAAPEPPKPTKEPEQICAVCGTVTQRKCGPCARAGVGIYFCSQGHQDLVAKAHKPVCGRQLAPLPTPYFTKAEAELWRSLKDVVLPVIQGIGNGTHHEKATNHLRLFWVTDTDRATVLQRHRSDFFAVKRTYYDHAEFLESSGSAFDFAAYLYGYLHRFHRDDNFTTETKNLWHHRAVILGELCHLMVVKPKKEAPKEPTVMQVKAAVTLLLRTVLEYLPVPTHVQVPKTKPWTPGIVPYVKNEVAMVIGPYEEVWTLNARTNEVETIVVV
ncbi:hypothetical protein JCM3770_004173 [Rhodotorula araucariae]